MFFAEFFCTNRKTGKLVLSPTPTSIGVTVIKFLGLPSQSCGQSILFSSVFEIFRRFSWYSNGIWKLEKIIIKKLTVSSCAVEVNEPSWWWVAMLVKKKKIRMCKLFVHLSCILYLVYMSNFRLHKNVNKKMWLSRTQMLLSQSGYLARGHVKQHFVGALNYYMCWNTHYRNI